MGYQKDYKNYQSPYVDKNGELKNELGIDDEESLNKAERILTSYRLSQLYMQTGAKTFDSNHLKSIHKYLFHGIYPFAGEFRNENIAKRVTFCLVQYIEPSLNDTLEKAKEEIPKIKTRDDLVKFITVLYGDLDIIHPFREGNGRTLRDFMRQLIDYICEKNGLEGYFLDYSLIEDRDAYIDAVVNADCCNYSDLMALFDRILVVKPKKDNLGKKI